MANHEAVFTAYCTRIRLEYKRRRLLMEQMKTAKMLIMDANKYKVRCSHCNFKREDGLF